jgi:hypothetical protein
LLSIARVRGYERIARTTEHPLHGAVSSVLVIEPEVKNAAQESVRLRRTQCGLPLAADVIVASEQRVHDWREVKGSLIHAALTEARELVT